MNIDVNNKYVPAFLAMIVALCITLMVRMILPSSDENMYTKTEELPLPEIPFAEKNIEKNNDAFVLITTKNIGQWEKITSSDVTWKKWPREAISASFIAKDSKDNMLNDGGTYSSVLNMLAKFPIVKGVPITMSVLARKREIEKSEKTGTYTGPSEAQIRANVEKELREKFRQETRNAKLKEEEQKRRLAELEKQNKVKPGTGIVTVQIDQRSAPPAYFLKVGDYVDLKFSNYGRDGVSSYRIFENLKVISINGSRENNSSIENVKNVVDVTIRNLVVEGNEEDIADIISQIDKSQTAILIVKNQEDAQKEIASKMVKNRYSLNKTMINKVIANTIADTEKSKENITNSSEVNRIINLNNMFNSHVDNKQIINRDEKAISNSGFLNNFLKFEAHSSISDNKNKNISNSNPKSEIKIYRKFKESTVQFDANGNIIEANSDKLL